jgi:hypothetical protein
VPYRFELPFQISQATLSFVAFAAIVLDSPRSSQSVVSGPGVRLAQDRSSSVDERRQFGAPGAGSVRVHLNHAHAIRAVNELSAGVGRDVQHAVEIDVDVAFNVVIGGRHGTCWIRVSLRFSPCQEFSKGRW